MFEPIYSMLMAASMMLTIAGQESASVNKSSCAGVCLTQGCVLAANNFLTSMDLTADPCENVYQFACGKLLSQDEIPEDQSYFGSWSSLLERQSKIMKTLLQDDEIKLRIDSKAVNFTRQLYRQCMNVCKEGFAFSDALSSLLLSSTTPSLKEEYFLNATYQHHVDAYEKFIRDVVELLAKDAEISLPPKNVEDGVRDILKLETEIARFIVAATALDERKTEDELYNLRTLGQLKQEISNFDWQEFVESVLPDDVRSILTDDLVLNIASPSFLKNASQLLQNTDTKTLVNYAVWKMVKELVMANLLDERYRDIAHEFNRVQSGQLVKSPRWKICVDQANRISNAYGALYVAAPFVDDNKKEVGEVVNNLMHSFTDILSEALWMDNATKTAALKKLQSVVSLLGYAEEAKNATALDESYKDLNYAVAAIGYFESALSVETWQSEKAYRSLLTVRDSSSRLKYDVSAADVNAYYNAENNAISSQYDEIGRLRNWWSNSSMMNFKNKTECMVNQYNAFEDWELKLHMSGERTKSENIADNGGLKEAYRAYRKYIDEQVGHEEDRLPGLLDLSPNQLFFLSWATIWCEKSKPDQGRSDILSGVHSPGMFRIIGSLSNMPEFAAAFKCKSGSRMNPASRCAVW